MEPEKDKAFNEPWSLKKQKTTLGISMTVTDSKGNTVLHVYWSCGRSARSKENIAMIERAVACVNALAGTP